MEKSSYFQPVIVFAIVLLTIIFFLQSALLAPNVNADDSDSTGGLVPCNNKCTLCHILVGMQNIFKYLMGLLFVATMFFVTFAGALYMVSAGSQKLLGQAKDALSYCWKGFLVFLISWLVVTGIMKTVGYKQVSNWWQFECDTTQTEGPTTTTGAISTDTTARAGSCQGIGTQSGINKQCQDVSSDLSNLLACMKDKLPSGAQISSISDSQGYDNCRNNYSQPPCAHAKNSCHYGGNCNDGSHAADISTRNASGNDIMSAAKNCGANYVLNEGNHIHVSQGQNCGCK